MSFLSHRPAPAAPVSAVGTSRCGKTASRSAPVQFLLRFRPQILCVLAGILLFLLASRFIPPETDLVNGRALPRESYGGSTERFSVDVEGLSGEPLSVEIPVSARVYRDDEIGNIFSACMDELSVTICGNNPSLAEISEKMDLPSSVKKYGVKVTWSSSDPELLNSSGEVRNDDLAEARDVTLKAYLSDAGGTHTASYELPVTVLPKELTEEERLKKEFLAAIRAEDAAQSADALLTLPETFHGAALRYSQKSAQNYWIFLILGPAAGVLLLLRDRQQTADAGHFRERQMLLDYPEIISKLQVFIGAGMTIRLAWEAIVEDYENDRSASGGACPVHYAYEEMEKALAKLKTGAGEGQVYHEFGQACGLRQYMKLAGLLEQNRRSGIANIRMILRAEMNEAWEERKNMARRLGEEAGTKLLGPLFLMLVIVMVMIIVPAMLSF